MNRVLETWKEIGQDSLNLPNVLTLGRILLIPIFVLVFMDPTPERSLLAAVIFTAAAVTDLLDGYIARRTGQITKLGKLLDPIADKLLVLSALILLVNVDRVGALVAILIIARELTVTGVRAMAAGERMIIAAQTMGKYKMALQVVAIVLLILDGTWVAEFGNVYLVGSATLYLSLVLGYVSGWQYVRSFWKQIVAKGF
ncbi:CDP-diacylglycerol--glycerol-3-phosphate 3-phosphatidyltransferase [Candidatus Nitrospira inopinata]|jgi:CDP-diacylglycerol--glycerol-3-phosphate 3-phosphatidyltransferase|uniref:CDP-diacylglycerol--glycerol-3-phosphate 3-phosphatidyltransferase n=1 Tax=Candidatus Nitrospira inopinata TaxID=1715989 RepID=A0A0S4KXC7_9BACT|nr:CDP-diacylglycerol--glycerol-3-phosphate 3-phosphatidyltransferase [Candidatus Nitrospira inopinata]CUQ67838.1 CDP-diacylglycerol--glycerol-3-phosphate 3-phosphatidyltransferase [Candidatus Nitrospira inopinata]